MVRVKWRHSFLSPLSWQSWLSFNLTTCFRLPLPVSTPPTPTPRNHYSSDFPITVVPSNAWRSLLPEQEWSHGRKNGYIPSQAIKDYKKSLNWTMPSWTCDSTYHGQSAYPVLTTSPRWSAWRHNNESDIKFMRTLRSLRNASDIVEDPASDQLILTTPTLCHICYSLQIVAVYNWSSHSVLRLIPLFEAFLDVKNWWSTWERQCLNHAGSEISPGWYSQDLNT